MDKEDLKTVSDQIDETEHMIKNSSNRLPLQFHRAAFLAAGRSFLVGFNFLDCLPRESERSRLVGFDRTLLPSSQSCGLDITLLFKLLHDPRDGFFSPVEYPCNLVGVGGSAVPDPAGPYHFLH